MKPLRALAALSASLFLVACGSNEEPSTTNPPLAYTPTASTHTYAPHVFRSRVHANILGEIHIGGDIEPRERLDLVAVTDDDFELYLGSSRDGVGVHRLENYEADLLASSFRNGFRPFTVFPVLYLDEDLYEDEHDGLWWAIFDSHDVINDALPPEFQVRWGGPTNASSAGFGEILVRLESPAGVRSICGENAAACAMSPSRNRATVVLPDDLDTGEFIHPRSVIVHEMLHALGIWGHVDSIEFPDSIMGRAGEYIPNGRHIISKIDREILQIMYMSQLTRLYNDWGEWSDTSFHLMAKSADEEVQFGVALFNGLPQPWARGTIPDTSLEDSGLTGTATWEGTLVGFSGPSPIAGSAELQVNMRTLPVNGSEHDLRFRDIFYVSRFENQDLSAESSRWFSTRNIDYRVNFDGALFHNVRGDGYEDGWVQGSTMGSRHEHMAGTVKRTDMIGAFGGSR